MSDGNGHAAQYELDRFRALTEQQMEALEARVNDLMDHEVRASGKLSEVQLTLYKMATDINNLDHSIQYRFDRLEKLILAQELKK